MAEISKKVASLLVDSFVQGDDKLKGDSKIVADLAITGAQGFGEKVLAN
jgi:hypothetical protein